MPTFENVCFLHDIPRDVLVDIIVRCNGSTSLQSSCKFFRKTYDWVKDNQQLVCARILYNVVNVRPGHAGLTNKDLMHLYVHFPGSYIEILDGFLSILFEHHQRNAH